MLPAPLLLMPLAGGISLLLLWLLPCQRAPMVATMCRSLANEPPAASKQKERRLASPPHPAPLHLRPPPLGFYELISMATGQVGHSGIAGSWDWKSLKNKKCFHYLYSTEASHRDPFVEYCFKIKMKPKCPAILSIF